MWILFLFNLVFLTECRMGEAKTPGPKPTPCNTWSLGVCNPSGLQGKATLLSDIDAEVIAVSETHLTAVSRTTVLATLRAHSRYKHIVTGAPLAPRSTASDAGRYSGVAVLSAVPSRALCVDWPPDLYDTGRVQVVGSFLGNMWVTGAVAYGYPQSKYHQQATQRTDAMLEFLCTHMTAVATGPRYLCGDWNLESSQVGITAKLHHLGWRECQDLEFARSGQQPQVTCKMKTQKDFLWLSPELVASFRGLSVQHDRFPDHSTLVASFALDPVYATRYLWPMPVPVPWKRVPDEIPAMDFFPGSPTDTYRELWQAQEQQAQRTLAHAWQPNMAGRGLHTSPLKRQGWATPLKKGRTVDFQPQFFGFNVQHARWMKQLRRLHNYSVGLSALWT